MTSSEDQEEEEGDDDDDSGGDVAAARRYKPPNSSCNSTFLHVMGWDSSRSDIFGPSEKSEAQNQTQDAKNVAADDKSEGDAHRDKNAAYQQARIYPCSLSSSLYYGGRDIYISPSNLHKFDEDYKPDGEDDLTDPDPNAASRGNWWQVTSPK
ncbi:hypothetical protein Taro_047072 [Colocasia esculenta]|uniref:Uncharacterized protein n=1 Tax=Colocasia esculenta TaxID=4460 RepID=A0A843WVA4_COLES|nr:hypothetical protein [Colocasia esculenta]